jgi:HD superfamily phosphohydrolase
MLIKDRVYGSIEINDPVLVELINSRPLQRLKGIQVAGVVYKVLPWKNITRYEHCIGVMILLRKLEASIEEQIAGLLHDVPHTAFSHAVDFVFKNEDQTYHEKFHEKIVLESEIPKILQKYSFEIENILDEKKHTLLESKMPNLCADRVDYTLREFVARGEGIEKINTYVDSLTAFEGKIVFRDQEVAKQFSEEFLLMVQSWASPIQLTVVETIAHALKLSLEKGIIKEEDFFLEDEEVLEKMLFSKDEQIIKLLNRLTPNLKVIEDKIHYDYFSKEKARFVDPEILIGSNLFRVSKIYPSFEEKLLLHKKIMEKGIYARVVK